MFGGVSQTYCLWSINGEPYKKGNNYYVQVLHPFTKLPKEVRWYTDKSHAALMPKSKKDFNGKIFGFKDENDSIIMINNCYLSSEEEEKFFRYNWKNNGRWKFGAFFGGIWYAPVDEKIPPILNADKIQKCDWNTFKAEGKKLSQNYDFWKEV